jgi:hypothetical protein
MKPRFAVDLTNEAICLLERTGDGWVRIARADLDDPEIEVRLVEMRQKAEALAPEGFFTKLVLPNSQILYLEVEAPGPDRSSRRMQIRKALEGRTPYPVDDLVFDWSRNGHWVKVAVLAKETLDEAEAFAEANGFRPVAFVAVAEGERFAGEPFFGLTLRHLAHLPRGERFDRDQDPVRIVRDDTPPRALDMAPVAGMADDPEGYTAVDETQAEWAAMSDDTIGSDEMAAETVAEATLSPVRISGDADDMLIPEIAAPEAPFIAIDEQDDVTEPEETLAVAMPVPEPAPEPMEVGPPAGASQDSELASSEQAIEVDSIVDEPVGAVDAGAEPATEDASIATDAAPVAITDEPLGDATREIALAAEADTGSTAAEVEEGGDTVAEIDDARVETADDSAIISVVSGDPLDYDAVAEPTEAANSFQSRRSPGPSGQEGARLATITPRLGGFPVASHAPKSAPRLGAANPSPRAGSAPARNSIGNTPLAAALEASTAAAAGKAARVAAAGRSVFGGAKLPGAAAHQSQTGLIATGAAAIVVAALALWSFWPSASVTDTPEPSTELVTPAPDVSADGSPDVPDVPEPTTETADTGSAPPVAATDDVLAEAPTATGEPAPVDVASADTGAADAPPADAPADAVTSETATTATAEAADAPELPQPVAPTATAVLGQPTTVEGADAPAIAATEPAAPDATGATLPALGTVAGDLPLAPQPLPQPFGTLLRYDANGMIEATPDGVVTPDGFTLYDARPPVLPKARPGSLDVTAASAPTAATPNPLEGKPPRPRPAGLVVPVVPPTTPQVADPATNGAVTPDAAATTTTAALGPLAPPVDPRHAGLSPKVRPAKVTAAAEAARANADAVASAAAAAAKAEAEALATGLSNASKLAVASSRQPALRPAAIVKVAAAAAAAKAAASTVQASAVEAALAEAQTTPEPAPEPQPQAQAQAEPAPDPTADVEEPELNSDGVPNMPTTRTVAKKATIANALDLGDINLIGVFGSSSNRRALVRMPTGRLVKVQVGDRLDGGRVAAIGDNELSYVKKGRTYVLKMIRDS